MLANIKLVQLRIVAFYYFLFNKKVLPIIKNLKVQKDVKLNDSNLFPQSTRKTISF
jgi:hypothetical protein